MRFPYQYFEGKFLPIIPLKIKGTEGWVELRGFVDTGASYCLFHIDVAEVLGLKLAEGERGEMVLGDGDVLTVFVYNLSVSIAGKEFKAKIGFSKGLNINIYIIGRENIFEQFIVCFDEKEKAIEFKPRE